MNYLRGNKLQRLVSCDRVEFTAVKLSLKGENRTERWPFGAAVVKETASATPSPG